MLEVVLIGRSNVGKSTLMRELTGKRVEVGRRPGVTIKPVQVRRGDLLFTDLPGFGFMSGVDARMRERIKDEIVKYIENNRDRIIAAVEVVDAKSFSEIVDRWERRGEIPIDVEMYEFLLDETKDPIVAVNKMDKVKDPDAILDGVVDRLGMLPPWRQWRDKVAPISAKRGDIGPLRDLLRERVHKAGRDDLLKYL